MSAATGVYSALHEFGPAIGTIVAECDDMTLLIVGNTNSSNVMPFLSAAVASALDARRLTLMSPAAMRNPDARGQAAIVDLEDALSQGDMSAQGGAWVLEVDVIARTTGSTLWLRRIADDGTIWWIQQSSGVDVSAVTSTTLELLANDLPANISRMTRDERLNSAIGPTVENAGWSMSITRNRPTVEAIGQEARQLAYVAGLIEL